MRWIAASLMLAALAVGPGCLATSSPIRTVEYSASPQEPEPAPALEREADTLIVMLPGMGDTAEDYQTHGFIEALEQSGVNADVVAVDAHFGYYTKRELIPRLRDDVFAPARAKGYDSVWVVGISLGGFGALLAAQEFEQDIDGLVLLSPYLGTSRGIRQIESSGGIEQWTPPSEPGNYTEELWSWIKVYQTQPEQRPPLYLAYGDDEPRFPHAMLAEVLPQDRVFISEGQHGWKTWTKLWPEILDERPF